MCRLKNLKIITLFFLLLVTGLIIVLNSAAAPVGNPGGPVLLDGEYPTKFSLKTDFVVKRKLKSKSQQDPYLKGFFYMSKVSLYLGNRLDVYGLIGAYDGKIKEVITSSYIMDSKVGSVWGGGISYVIKEFEFKNGILRVGFDAKYRQSNPDVDTVKQDRAKIDVTRTALRFKEWQASIGLSYQYRLFVPYFGLKYSDMDVDIRFNDGSNEYIDKGIGSKNTFGIFVGFDYLLNDFISLNFETRQIDERSINIGINARF